MKFLHLLAIVVIFLAGCSSPKYAYHFDRYDYNSGRKGETVIAETPIVSSPLVITHDDVMTADLKSVPAPVAENAPAQDDVKAARETYKAMSKDERKAFRKAVISEIKKVRKDVKKSEGVESTKATQRFDTLSALAIIFGGAGIVLIMLANISNVFWVVGAISLAIGAFFFVKWVSEGNG